MQGRPQPALASSGVRSRQCHEVKHCSPPSVRRLVRHRSKRVSSSVCHTFHVPQCSLLTAARFHRQLLTTEADSCDRLHSDMRMPIVTIRCRRPHCKINCGSQSNYRHTKLGQKSLWLKRSLLSPVSTAFFGTVMTALLFNMLLTVVSHHPPKSH